MLAALLLASSVALAHDDAHTKAVFDVSKAEQKEFGIAGDPARVHRTIKLVMRDDMRFTPNRIKVKEGETVKLVIKNKGKILHEIVLGTTAQLQEHAAMMRKFPTMAHEAPYMAHVKPGAIEEIVWTFNRPGEFDFACLIAGHFEAGMTGKIQVGEKNRRNYFN
ncbi:plastocyanin/azurin family copper-binding protein [Herminiimonas glaciei]|uniref:Plastocyanin/azurin family copper-binding protein n=1 Tax=Herminiimonas glaciei TaxID=523788 RepID=A0ABW2I8P7_9BURK